MKKELKLLGKYVGMAVLITTFVILSFSLILDKISAYQELSKLLTTEGLVETEMIEHLKGLERHILEAAEGTGNLMKEQGYEDYPALGAHIEFIYTTTRFYYGLYELSFAIPLGILIGILYYLAKKEFKKTIHYVFVFTLIFVLLMTVVSMVSYVRDFISDMSSPEFDWENMCGTMKVAWLPYVIGCIFVYIVMCVESKKKTDLLNKEINKL